MNESLHKIADHQDCDKFQKITGANYFIRHWRGELSLGISFWVNGVVLGIVFGFFHSALFLVLDLILSSSQIPDSHPKTPGLLFTLYISDIMLYLFMLEWQVLGIWRSASLHIATTGRRFFASIVKLLCLPFFLIVIALLIFASLGTYKYLDDTPAFLEMVEDNEPNSSY